MLVFFYTLFLLMIESVFVIPSILYYFSEGVLLMLGRSAETFLGLGMTGPIP